MTCSRDSHKNWCLTPHLGIGAVLGLSFGIVGTNGLHKYRAAAAVAAPAVPVAADCAERMNAAARACDALPGGFVEFRNGTIVCRNTNPTVKELRP